MNAAILMNNREIQTMIEKMSEFETTKLNNLEELENQEYDVFIFEQHYVDYLEIMSIRDKNDHLKLIMIQEDHTSDSEKIYVANDVMLISEDASLDDVKNLINQHLFNVTEEERLENVVAISGTHPQVGVTQTALSIASAIHHEYGKSVGIIGLNAYNPGIISTVKSKDTLDQVYDLIKNNILTPKKLLNMMVEVNGIKYLLGNDDVLKNFEYEEEPIENLIRMASESFDIVILDLGSIYDNALSLSGLKLAQMHVLLCSQQEISSVMFQKWKEKVLIPLDILPEDSIVVVNKYRDDLIKTMNQLSKEFNMPLMAKIPYLFGAIDDESDLGLLYLSTDKSYQKNIKKIIKGLFNDFKEKSNEQRPRKKRSLIPIFR